MNDPVNRLQRFGAVLIKLLFGLLYATSLSQLILRLNQLPIQPLQQALAILLTLVLLTVLTWGCYQLLVVTGLLSVTALMLWLTSSRWVPEEGLAPLLDPWLQRASWSVDYLLGYTSGQVAQKQWLALVICVLLALLTYLIVVRFNSPAIAAVVLLTTVILAQQMQRNVLYGWSFAAAIAVIAALARNQKKTWRFLSEKKQVLSARFMLQSLPAAAVVLTLSLLLSAVVPPSFFHSRRFEGLVDDVMTRLSGIQWEQQSIPDFSLQQAGFYPLTERLGGPVVLSDTPVLRISGTDEVMLLKGAVRQIYDGSRWIQDLDRSYYRYDSPLWQAEQTEVFDLNRPNLSQTGLTMAQFSQSVSFSWSPIGLPTRTLFSVGKPLRVSLAQQDPFIAYFRPSGQLFSKHWIRPDQSIETIGRIPRTRLSNFEDMIRQIQLSLNDEDLEIPVQIAGRYLQLPSLPEYDANGMLRRLVFDLTAESKDPYGAVLDLRAFLMQNYRYSLDVAVPPEGSDFVTWFLQSGEGYCVYFASALTMMSRLAGIPARYVEGYYVPPVQTPGTERILTGREAHAWTEIFLAGIGWIAVDATPGAANPSPDPRPSVDPDATPQPSPSPQADLSPTPDPAVTLTPPVDPDTPDPAIDPGRPDSVQLPWLWLLLLLPLLLAAGIALLLQKLKQRHDPVFLRRTLPDPATRALFYWSELKILLQALGCEQTAGRTAAQFVSSSAVADDWLAGREEGVLLASQGLDDTIYGPGKPSEAAVSALARLYDILEETVRQNRGTIRWLAGVIKRGIRHGKQAASS